VLGNSNPERQKRNDQDLSRLDSYKEYLLKHWDSSCYETKDLFEEIQNLA
jgi:hypothetical protein